MESWSVQGIAQDILKKFNEKTVFILSPVVRGRAGTYEELFATFKKESYVKARVDDTVITLYNTPSRDRYQKHTIQLVRDEIFGGGLDREQMVASL